MQPYLKNHMRKAIGIRMESFALWKICSKYFWLNYSRPLLPFRSTSKMMFTLKIIIITGCLNDCHQSYATSICNMFEKQIAQSLSANNKKNLLFGTSHTHIISHSGRVILSTYSTHIFSAQHSWSAPNTREQSVRKLFVAGGAIQSRKINSISSFRFERIRSILNGI